MSTINLETELIRRNEATLAKERKLLDDQAKIDALVDNMLQVADDKYRDELLGTLGFDYKIREAQQVRSERDQFKHLPAERIFDVSAIKAICIEYGLRCLPTRHFKGQLDSQLGAKLEELRRMCGGKLPEVDWEEWLDPVDFNLSLFGSDLISRPPRRTVQMKTQFFICAPADQFVLQDKPKDPLLFCRLSLDKFYLMHKWGDDLETAHLRAGQTTDKNWNSVYKPEPEVEQKQKVQAGVVDQDNSLEQYRANIRARNEEFKRSLAAKNPGFLARFFNQASEE